VVNSGNGLTSYCCVGGTLAPLTLSVCAGWPICTGPTTVTQTNTPLSCVTNVPMLVSNWDASASSYSASLAQSGADFKTTLTGGGSSPAATAGIPSETGTTASSAPASSTSGISSEIRTTASSAPASSTSGISSETGTTSSSAPASSTSTGAAVGLGIQFGAIAAALIPVIAMV
jgi:hypothetical protein